MLNLHERVLQIRHDIDIWEEMLASTQTLFREVQNLDDQYEVMLEAQQLLSAVSSDNTTVVLDYLCGVINKALLSIFPSGGKRVTLEKTLYRNQYPHIYLKLKNKEGIERHIQLQEGSGVRKVVSFMFVLALIELRKERRLLLADELLGGLHQESKEVVQEIVSIFAEEGFQFVFVEYGLWDKGKLYITDMPDKVAKIEACDWAEYKSRFMNKSHETENG